MNHFLKSLIGIVCTLAILSGLQARLPIGSNFSAQYAAAVDFTLTDPPHTTVSTPSLTNTAVILVMGQSNVAQYTNYVYTPAHAADIYQFLYSDGTIRQWVQPNYGPYGFVTHTGTTHGTTTMDGLSGPADLQIGMMVTGPGIPVNTTITAIGATDITLSNAATTSTTNTFEFALLVGTWFGELANGLIASGKFTRVIYCLTGIGGTLASQWAPAGIYNSVYTTALKRLRAAGLPITMVLTGQGETESLMGSPTNLAWAANWRQIVLQSRNFGYTGPWFFPIQTWINVTGSGFVGRADPTGITQAQQASIVDNSKGIYAGPNLDAFGNAYRYDGTHLNSTGGGAWANAWEGVIVAHSF